MLRGGEDVNREELEAQIGFLEDRLRVVEDAEEIKKLQRIYGHYLDYGMWDEVVDLFSDNAVSIEVADFRQGRRKEVYYGRDESK
jgi:hypothetical protein